MDTKQQVIVVKDGGWGAQQKQHQIDEPQDKDHGQLPDAADVQEDRAGQETQQHVPNEVLRGDGSGGVGWRQKPGIPTPCRKSPALPSTTSNPKLLQPLHPAPHHAGAPGCSSSRDSGETWAPW